LYQLNLAYGETLGLLFLVTHLVAGLVRLLVVVLFKVPFPGVVLVMGFVIVAITLTDLVVLVFRIILVLRYLWGRIRRSPYGASGDSSTQHHRQNPDTLP
jgi:hypothetical protein